MRMSNAFPSKYLRAADLDGRQVTVSIDRVVMEDVGDDDAKPVLYFVGKEKGVVLNKTNASNISLIYGDETDDWHGKPVTLYEAMVDFQGRSVAAIRIKGPPRQHHQAPLGSSARRPDDPISSGPAQPPASHPINDDIPF